MSTIVMWVGILFVWFALGFLGCMRWFTYVLYARSSVAAKDYRSEVIYFWGHISAGPAFLLTSFIQKDVRVLLQKQELLMPGKKAYAIAVSLERDSKEAFEKEFEKRARAVCERHGLIYEELRESFMAGLKGKPIPIPPMIHQLKQPPTLH